MLRVLYVTPELAPWVKAGGLGEVAHDLPRALAAEGVDARVLVPAFPALLAAFPSARPVAELASPGGRVPAARLLEASGPVPLYLLDCPPCYAREGGAYGSPDGADWPDNAIRFGLLSWAAALVGMEASSLAWRPQIVHCNDWPTGLAPAWLALNGGKAARSLVTIHNLAHQGIFPKPVLDDLALPEASFTVEGLEYHGQVSFLKAGLAYATRVSTVSPTYAREIQGPELGFGLDGVLRKRGAALAGIMNGIDTAIWDPARDPHLAERYDAGRLEAKAANKAALQRELGLAVEPAAPLLGMVSRLVEQKGADLVIAAAPELLALGAQLAVLGRGERRFEQALAELARRHPRQAALRTSLDEPLAHRIEAGADLFLMPSRFEPCGLNQLYSMRYGTPPIVRRTGGLADSVADGETGLVFDEPSVPALLGAVRRGLAVYRQPERWRVLQRTGMGREVGWAHSARAYRALYEEMSA